MKKIYFPLFLLASFFLSEAFSQSSNFNIDLYKEFLQSHQDMTFDQLLEMHPAGSFSETKNSF